MLFHSYIKRDCSAFIAESRGFPAYKTIHVNSPPLIQQLYKIKVRHKNTTSEPTLNELYSAAFEPKLRERSVIVHGNIKLCESSSNAFYIFPKDGYEFLYSKDVTCSAEDYKEVFNTLKENMQQESAFTILTDMLKFSYTDTKIDEGLKQEAEILIYNIPFFYAVPVSAYPNYNTLYEKLRA